MVFALTNALHGSGFLAEGKSYMFFKPWVIVIPGLALALLVLAINLVGDGLRDVNAPDGRN